MKLAKAKQALIHECLDLQGIQNIIDLLSDPKEGNFICFLEFQKLIYKSIRLLNRGQQWEFYKQRYSKKIAELFACISFRLSCIPNYQVIYPDFDPFVKEFITSKSKMNLSIDRPQFTAHMIDPQQDKTLRYFVEEIRTRKGRQSSIYLRDPNRSNTKVQIGHFISDFYTTNKEKWQSVLGRLGQFYEESFTYEEKKIERLPPTIHQERLNGIKCIGCCPFFYQYQRIENSYLNECEIIVITQISKIRQYESKIKESICSLLNGRGGVILFDCKDQNLQIQPVGRYLTQKDKQKYEQSFGSFLQCFHPQLVLKKDVDITFVPVIQNLEMVPPSQRLVPYPGIEKDDRYKDRPYLQGMYVMRAKITPMEPQKTYYFTVEPGGDAGLKDKASTDDRLKPYFFKRQNYKNKQIVKEEIYEFMENRYRSNILCKKTPKYLQKIAVDCQNCRQVELGSIVTEKSIHRMDFSGDFSRERIKQSQLQPRGDPQSNFKFMSLLIAKKSDMQTLKSKLKQRKQPFHIQSKFAKYKFKSTANSFILYHQKRFDQLLKLVAQFKFQDKKIILIIITRFIQLDQKYEREQLLQIKSYLVQEFPGQSLKLWSYQEDQIIKLRYFLELENKTSSLFIYFMLQHYHMNAWLRVPKNFNKLIEEKSKALKLLDELH